MPIATEVIGLHGCVALRSSHAVTQSALQPAGAASTWPPPDESLPMSACIFVVLLPFFVVDVVEGRVRAQYAALAASDALPQQARHTRRLFLSATPALAGATAPHRASLHPAH